MGTLEEEPLWRHFEAPRRGAKEIKIVEMFQMFADDLITTLPRTAERTVALRKLIEARDCAVRAVT